MRVRRLQTDTHTQTSTHAYHPCTCHMFICMNGNLIRSFTQTSAIIIHIFHAYTCVCTARLNGEYPRMSAESVRALVSAEIEHSFLRPWNGRNKLVCVCVVMLLFVYACADMHSGKISFDVCSQRTDALLVSKLHTNSTPHCIRLHTDAYPHLHIRP